MEPCGDPAFAQRWRRAVDAAGEQPFLLWEGSDGATATWTYAEFDEVVRTVAGFLAASGIHGEDGVGTVHVALANSPAFVAVWLAAAVLGATFVPSDPQATARELAACMRRTRPAAGIGSVRRSAAYLEAAELAGVPAVLIDEDDLSLGPLRGKCLAASDLPPPGPGQRLAVMFTSGTTSQPKGVVLTQANYAFAGDTMAAAAGLAEQDRQIVVLPLFHANAQYYSFAAAICAGASVALMHTFSASRFAGQAARYQATHASLFAAPLRMILARNQGRPPGLRLRHCWYAQNLTTAQYEDITQLLGCRPRQLYGMTETGPAVITSHPLDAAADVMGTVTLGCRVELRDPETGRPAAPGQAGEIVVGGRRGRELFDGYLDDPATTDASFRDGWFSTGDLAYRDKPGRFRFAGRRGDVLKVAGENVSIVEVEAVLADHPAVFEAAVVGEPDPVRDEVPVAYVVLRPSAPPVPASELMAWCAERLSPAKRPRQIWLRPELPRTSVGKIRKFMLAPSAEPGP